MDKPWITGKEWATPAISKATKKRDAFKMAV
jgi:hypothetical protein